MEARCVIVMTILLCARRLQSEISLIIGLKVDFDIANIFREIKIRMVLEEAILLLKPD
jgi:hypothetical protein